MSTGGQDETGSSVLCVSTGGQDKTGSLVLGVNTGYV